MSIYIGKKTMIEALSVGLHQINLYFGVLVRRLLRDTRNTPTKKTKTSTGGSNSGSSPNWPLFVYTTSKGPVGRHKVFVKV